MMQYTNAHVKIWHTIQAKACEESFTEPHQPQHFMAADNCGEKERRRGEAGIEIDKHWQNYDEHW